MKRVLKNKNTFVFDFDFLGAGFASLTERAAAFLPLDLGGKTLSFCQKIRCNAKMLCNMREKGERVNPAGSIMKERHRDA